MSGPTTLLLLVVNALVSFSVSFYIVMTACNRAYLRTGDVPDWCGHNSLAPVAAMAIVLWFLLLVLVPFAWKRWRKRDRAS
jgi:hypothetical protein